jgi:hypothetical protein
MRSDQQPGRVLVRAPQPEAARARRLHEHGQAILAYIVETNADPKPFVRTKSADDILASLARFCQRTFDSNTSVPMRSKGKKVGKSYGRKLVTA